MKLATTAELRRIEANYMEQSGLPDLVLIETAAHSIAAHIAQNLPTGRVAVICGMGTNGADGLAAARHLHSAGILTDVFLVGGGDALLPAIQANLQALAACGIPLCRIRTEAEAAVLPSVLRKADWVLDALLGIGLTGDVRPLCAEVIRFINESPPPVLALDMPSGICADTGHVMGVAVHARETLTFIAVKRGLALYPGAAYAGRVTLNRIGLPAFADTHILIEMPEAHDIRNLLPKRPICAHKYSFGRVLSVCGCDNMPGAAVMAAIGAYRAGAGLVTAASTRHVAHTLQAWVKEAVTVALPDEGGALCRESALALRTEASKADVILLGPGLSNCPAAEGFVETILPNIDVPVVIDADALNILAKHKGLLAALAHKTPTLLTPHMGEMSRLTGLPAAELATGTIGAATALARETGAFVLLKDARTIIAAPDGRVSVNPTGCSALAKAGSGDVLAGLIAGFAAQGLKLYDAARTACYIHGLAGEQAAAYLSAYGVTATDLLEQIPKTIQTILTD